MLCAGIVITVDFPQAVCADKCYVQPQASLKAQPATGTLRKRPHRHRRREVRFDGRILPEDLGKRIGVRELLHHEAAWVACQQRTTLIARRSPALASTARSGHGCRK